MNNLIQKMRLFQIILMVALCAVPAVTVHALSIGGYVDTSSGSGKYKWDTDIYDFYVDTDTSAIGFVLDTASMGGTLFNYRINAGIESQTMVDDTGLMLKTTGVAVENIFGFAIMSGPDFRWWAGPLLRFGAYYGELERPTYTIEYDFAQVGVGLVTGANFKVGNRAILAPSLGIRSIDASGTGVFISGGGYAMYEEDISGDFRNIFFNLAILF